MRILATFLLAAIPLLAQVPSKGQAHAARKGSEMPPTIWTLAGIEIALSAEYRLVSAVRDKVPTVIPDVSVAELSCRWEVDAGRSLNITWWSATIPPRPGGPMVAAEEWTEVFAGQTVRAARTSMFHGGEQETFVAWIPLKESRAFVLLNAQGTNREELNRILKSGRLAIRGPVRDEQLLCRPLAADTP